MLSRPQPTTTSTASGRTWSSSGSLRWRRARSSASARASLTSILARAAGSSSRLCSSSQACSAGRARRAAQAACMGCGPAACRQLAAGCSGRPEPAPHTTPTWPSCWPTRWRSAGSTAAQAPAEKRSSAPPRPRRTQGGRSSRGSRAMGVSLVDTCVRGLARGGMSAQQGKARALAACLHKAGAAQAPVDAPVSPSPCMQALDPACRSSHSRCGPAPTATAWAHGLTGSAGW